MITLILNVYRCRGNMAKVRSSVMKLPKKQQPRSRKCCFCGKNSYADVYCTECEQRKKSGDNIYIKRCCYCGRAVARKRRLFVYSPGLYCCAVTGDKRKCIAKLSALMQKTNLG